MSTSYVLSVKDRKMMADQDQDLIKRLNRGDRMAISEVYSLKRQLRPISREIEIAYDNAKEKINPVTPKTEKPKTGKYYKILYNDSAIELEIKVNENMLDGYYPIGNITVVDNIYYQAMVKQEMKGGKNTTRKTKKAY